MICRRGQSNPHFRRTRDGDVIGPRPPQPHQTETANVTEADIYARLTKVFHDVFADDELQIHPKMTADDVPEWDSMSHVRLMLTVERAFNTKFAAAEIAGLKNVGDLVSVIQRHNGT
jgi:acyl carrier protein